MKKLARIVFIYVLLSSPPFAAYAQQPKNAIDVTVMFTELHANAPVGGCGCFWMAGGTGEVAIPIGRNCGVLRHILAGFLLSGLPSSLRQSGAPDERGNTQIPFVPIMYCTYRKTPDNCVICRFRK